MAGRWASSVKESVGCGAARSGAAARSTGSPGSGCVATSTAGFRPRMFATRTLGRAATSSPKAGARCGNAARRDLCRGLWVTMIPTATVSARSLRGSQWKDGANPLVAQPKPAPEERRHVDREERVGEERIAHAHVRRDGSAEVAGPHQRAEHRGARDQVHDQTRELEHPEPEDDT